MSTIRRANHYVTYLIALVLSGAFSLLGRPGPAWAQEIKAEHNAKVFQQLYAAGPTPTPEPLIYTRPPSAAGDVNKVTSTHKVTNTPQVVYSNTGADPNRSIVEDSRYVDMDKTVWVGGSADASRLIGSEPLNVDIAHDNRVDIAPSIQDSLRAVKAKIQSGDTTLSTEDTAFLLSMETAAAFNQLSNQMNVLIKMVKELKESIDRRAIPEKE
jgi:hypothetical protein